MNEIRMIRNVLALPTWIVYTVLIFMGAKCAATHRLADGFLVVRPGQTECSLSCENGLGKRTSTHPNI